MVCRRQFFFCVSTTYLETFISLDKFVKHERHYILLRKQIKQLMVFIIILWDFYLGNSEEDTQGLCIVLPHRVSQRNAVVPTLAKHDTTEHNRKYQQSEEFEQCSPQPRTNWPSPCTQHRHFRIRVLTMSKKNPRSPEMSRFSK